MLYDASNAGVIINILVRGICCLVPGVKEMSENVTVKSIVGRFLEHERIYCFGEGKDAEIFISSADLMKRSLNRRIEVACPIFDEAIKKSILKSLNLHLGDNVKSRIIDKNFSNNYFKDGKKPLNSQVEMPHIFDL